MNTHINAILDVEKAGYRRELEALLKSLAIPTVSFSTEKISDLLSRVEESGIRHSLFLTDKIGSGVIGDTELPRITRLENILLVDDDNKESILDNPDVTKFSHIVSCNQQHIPHQQLMTTVAKIRDNQFFGVDKVVNFGAFVHRYSLSHSEQRHWFRDTLFEFVQDLSEVMGRPLGVFAQYAVEIQEEILMNSIWDANPRLKIVDRRIPVALQPHEAVQVEWSFDGTHLAIGVRDPFGTFEASTVNKYVKYLFSKNKKSKISVESDGAGAGIGLFMVLERLSSMIVNVTPGHTTEVIALVDLTVTPRAMARRQRSFQFFCV